MNAEEIIDLLPWELQARLEADEFFRDIPVVVAEEGDVALEVQRKQALLSQKDGHSGIAVIVLQMIADDDYPEVAQGPMTLRPGFQVVENLQLNRGPNGTKKSARKVARRIVKVIKPLALYGIVSEFVADSPCISPVKLGDELGALVKSYAVNFRAKEAAEDDEIVSPPEFAIGDGKLTISSTTEDATIWWTMTTDGTEPEYPADGKPGAAIYVEPITIPEGGMTVRAGGFKAGLIGSQIVRADVVPQA